MIQDSGLIDMKKAKEVRNYKVNFKNYSVEGELYPKFKITKISLRIDEQDLVEKLQDEAFMADILTNKLYK